MAWIDLRELQEIDFEDLSSWPIWFRWAMVLLISAGLLFAGYKYFIEPGQKQLVKLEREEEQLRRTFLDKKALVVNLPAYERQMVEIQDRFGVVLRQLPNKAEVQDLLIDISQAGLARGLKFRQFKPGVATAEGFYKTLPISITVTGRFHQLAEFVSDLSSLPRIVTVGNMNIRREEDNQLSMVASLLTYQYLEGGAAEEDGAQG